MKWMLVNGDGQYNLEQGNQQRKKHVPRVSFVLISGQTKPESVRKPYDSNIC